MEESRTKNSIKNVKTGAIVQIINKLMVFVVRTVFIRCLNSEYLGVNGLFSNIITILSFAELGVGTAIIFNMYKPVAEKNKEKIKSLMQLYKKSYNAIGIIVLILGTCLIPFLKYLVKDVPNIKENINIIYFMFLLNTATSYFFTYKKSIISAHQKQYIIDKYDSVIYFVKSIVEIVILIITKNFIVYLTMEILFTFIENFALSKKAEKMYPYLMEKEVRPLEKNEKKNIFQNVMSLIVYKFGGVIMNGTDNILLSSLVSVNIVGFCSNYSMLINSIKYVIISALNGITASVGNLNVTGNSKQKEKVFYTITFANYIVYSFCAVAFIILLNPFIKIWLGEKFVLELSVPFALAISFLIEGLRNPGFTYRTTLGLFQKGKATPYIGATTNIIFSILLCKLCGVSGIFFATSIAQLVSYAWIDPYLIHKYEFKTPVSKYFKKYLKYCLVFTIITIITLLLAQFIKYEGWIGLIVKAIIVFIVPNVINLIFFYKTEEFKLLFDKIIRPYYKKIRK